MTVTDSDLAAVSAPVEQARGLPNACYTDPAHFAREADAVFFASWAGLAFAADAPEPGDVKPVRFLGQPLLLARDREGVLRVFLNVCRHRGMILVEEAARLPRAIRCPYHSWCYELDGRLRTTPHVGGPGTNRHAAIDRAQLGLVEVRSHVWMGVVWVNLDGKAPEFETYAADLRARWAAFDRPLAFAPDGAFELEVACNWKLAVENYCESYHLPWVHPGLNSYSRLEDHYNIEAPGTHSGQGTRAYRPMLAEDGRRFPVIAGLDAQWEEGAEYVALYPNVLLGVHKDHAFAILLCPQGPERTVERIAIGYFDTAVLGEDWAPMRARNAAMWKEVFEEDIFVVEGMQKGRHAGGFDGGRFSPVMDSPTHCFHAWVAERLRQPA
ncbi:aromatic ring-hydroxylating dioxygenase subunit alpha [Paralimibaculum aggregatum]|uniref:Aromatic ring-hydroxylating dioxygenase subunit alpha n=1 Tax=Paralimibaculum aggregatum TaxID=3036245 RepID=A0ABQ6LRU7_9RHOB|nr:aromatic ring-hydroxylating dioxygenase subunit alpha [Limibaculum sp. NKW23]GMG84070.1 aromatic ring-hydroxylating dioxygenase subunit alpha [Limibaculum sp. NKW23]